ncbi:hypothetical protein VPH35_118402 [Triticum aestivum]
MLDLDAGSKLAAVVLRGRTAASGVVEGLRRQHPQLTDRVDPHAPCWSKRFPLQKELTKQPGTSISSAPSPVATTRGEADSAGGFELRVRLCARGRWPQPVKSRR